jgi:hypothetical protein
MEIDYEHWDHQGPGIEKTVCAWIIFLVLVLLICTVGLI